MNVHIQPKRRLLSLDTVDLQSPALRSVRSPRSLKAIESLGLQLQDLLYVPITTFQKTKTSPDVAEAAFKLHEDLRIRRLQAAVEARKKLLEGERTHGRSASSTSNVEEVIKSMRTREERRIRRLEQRKEQELMQYAVISISHKRPPSTPKLSKTARQSPVLRPIRLSERPVRQSEPQALPKPEIPAKSCESSSLLETLKAKLQARALSIAAAKGQKASFPTHSSTPTQTRPSRTPSAPTDSLARLELRERRHTEAMASLANHLEQRRQDKQSFWRSKRLKLQALEATQEQNTQKEREKLLFQHKQAFIRLQSIEKDRETDINQRTALENAKYHRSKRRKSRLDQLNAQRASADLDEYLLAEQKSVEIRQNHVENMRKTGELRDLYRESRKNEAERVKRMADFRRKQTLERITEEEEQIRRLKMRKEQEMLLKQQLRKQLETQKQLITERFEHLETVKGPRLVRSLNPSTRKAISVH